MIIRKGLCRFCHLPLEYVVIFRWKLFRFRGPNFPTPWSLSRGNTVASLVLAGQRS
jgi:hypothetical protein